MRHLQSILLSLLLGLALAVHSQQGFLDTNKLALDGRAVTTANYPNADDVMLDDVIRIEYAPDGCAISWDDTAVKVLTETGRRSNRVLRFHFNQSYERVALMLVQLIAEDGKTTDLNVDEISSVMTDRSQMSSNIYDPNDKILQANIPNLQLNTIVRYMLRREIIKPRVPKSYSDYEVFEYTSPILHTTYSILAPRELPLQRREILSPFEDTLVYSQEEVSEGILHKWVATNVPQAFPEPQMPKLFTCVQRVLVSTIPTWQELSKWYWQLCLPHLKTTPEIEAKVQELIQGREGDTQKIRSIFRFVSQEVRYMGETTETEAPGYEPHDVAQTFSKRHGVCRDKAALLCAMLRSAGFNAYPVLIYVGPPKDKEVPQPYFNHAITCVEKDGSYMLMDSTNENTADLFPAYLANCSYLVATPGGEDLQLSPVPPSSENRLLIDSTGNIDESGALTGNTTMHFKGINDNMYRGFFAESTPEDIRNFLEKVVNNTIPGALLKDYELLPKDLMDTEKEVSIKLVYRAPAFISANDELSFLRIPRFADKFGIQNYIIGDASLDKRRFPFKCRYKCSVSENSTFHYAPCWGITDTLPKYKDIQCDTMTCSQKLAQGNFCLKSNFDMGIETILFSPEQYSELKENLKTIEINNRKMAILRKVEELPIPENTPDIIKLSETSEYDLSSPFAWTARHHVKYKILTYGGKKDYSELKFQFIPDFEEVSLTYAKVYNGDACTELNLSENKLMDASWNGSAPRYPKGRTLVANLPAVEIGSIVEYEYTTKQLKGDVPFSFVTSFRSTVPILDQRVSITHPVDLSPNITLSQNGTIMPDGDENVTYETAEINNTIRHTWECKNQKPYPIESNLPRIRTIMPSLSVSFGSWKSYCQQLKNAVESRCYASQELYRTIQEMQGMEDFKKVRAIRDVVVRSIRPAGPHFTELPFSEMTTATTTMADGYGNEMDRALLLYTLLKGNGFKPELVLVQSSLCSEKIEKELLSQFAPTLFATPVIRVKCNGIWVWMNEGTQYAEPGTCAYEGHKALTLNGKIFTIEVPDEFKSKTTSFIHVRLFANGDARLEVTKKYFGTSHNALNKQISEQTQEERRRYHLSLLDGLSATATPDGELFTDVASYPSTVKYAANLKNFGTPQGDFLYLRFPRETLFHAPQNRRILPFEYTGHSSSQTEVLVELPYEYRTVAYMAPSQKRTLPGDTFTYRYKASSSRESITLTTAKEANPFLIPAAKYEELQAMIHAINSPSLNTIILSK